MTDQTFPRAARLTHRPEFERVLSKGQRTASALFRASLLHGGERPRLGITVSRRVSTRAVVRNRIRRAIRESFRRNQHRLPPMELVVVARFEAADATPEALRGALERLWQRVAALKPPADAGTMPPASDPLSDCPRPADPAPGAPEPVRP